MIDFTAARKRIEAMLEVELEPMPVQATMLERIQLSLNHDDFYELVHLTLEECK